MKKILKIAVVTTALALMLIPDSTYAQFGIRRRAVRRTVVVGSTVAAADSAQMAQAQQQTAAAQKQAAASQQQAAAAKKEAAAAEKKAAAAKHETAVAEGLLPLGTVVPTLPAGCAPTAVGGVEYYHCGVNYYRAVFQGNNLVYVTAQPK
jgi:glucose/arabinose dehydrogenase